MKATHSLLAACGLAIALAQTAGAANVLMINFSSASGNDMNATDATTLGVDLYQNVRTNATNSAGTTAAISLDGVTGSVTYADYYQQNQLAQLGQPYATLVGPNQIGSTGLSVDITLNLATWKVNNSATSYRVTVFYAGRSADSQTLMTDDTPDVFLTGGLVNTSDTVTVTGNGGEGFTGLWRGIGESQTFTSDTLDIEMNYLGGTSVAFQAGISAIKIEAIPEPSTWLACSLGGLLLLRRRRD